MKLRQLTTREVLLHVARRLDRIETLLRGLEAQEKKDMSKISDAIAAANGSADAAISRVNADLVALKAKINELQKTIDQGGASQTDLDALALLQAKYDALDPSNPATLAHGHSKKK